MNRSRLTSIDPDSTKFSISFSPSIGLCDTDKTIHTVALKQLDSTIGGCYHFAFQDCVGNISFDTLCMKAHKFISVGVGDRPIYILSLLANHPNPFSNITTFNYSIAEYGAVRLYLYDELGKEIARIVDNEQAPGSYSIDFDGSKLPVGSYIVRLESGGGVVSRKVIIER